MPRLTRSLSLLLPLALYFALALPQLMLPGLHNDEAVEAGLPAAQILLGQPITAFREAGVPIAGRLYPLMVQDYIGAFNVYLLLPVFALLGPSVVALRLYSVLIGAVTIALTFGFAAQAVGRRPAFIAAGLLAASPSFIFWQRQGVFVTSLTAALAIGILWAGLGWARRGGWRRAALVGVLGGAGLYAKLLFIWILGGVIGALSLINLAALVMSAWPRTNRQPFKLFPRTPTAPELLALGVGLLLALSPLFIYNLQTGGTLLSIGSNLTASYYGVNNLNIAENLSTRLDQFRTVITGAGLNHLGYLGGSFENPMWASALNLSALVIVGRWLFGRQRARLPVVLLFLLALGVLQSSFTASGLFSTHFALFTPLWPLLVALASETILNPFYEPMFIRLTGPTLSMVLGEFVRGWLGFVNMGMVVLTLGLSILFVRDVTVTLQYQAALQKSGGLGQHSDAIYRLVDYLDERFPAGTPILAMDWGFAPQVKMLTRSRLEPQEIFGYSWEADAGFADRLNAALDQPGAVFVFHVAQETLFHRREQFEAALQERGWKTESLVSLARRDGAPFFEVVTIHR